MKISFKQFGVRVLEPDTVAMIRVQNGKRDIGLVDFGKLESPFPI